ncbi:hypothetical protein [Enhygromyxa salina]|uniref:hypothetical protein n=1 Tax=Enhygromyxa salina TaxID=215803 RepID=UPI000D088262|nr:hypothetical protein [Enhygromyxa salina]
MVLGLLACAPDPQEPNAFMTQGYSTQQTGADTDTSGDSAESGDSADTEVPQDLPSGDGDGDGDTDPGDTGTGDGDGDTGPGDGDTTGNPICGNGLIDDGEQCDGGNLGGFTCMDLGYSGGTLGCDPITCTYDAAACVTDMDGGGGTTG